MKKVVLAKGRERSVIKNHPWIFSGAVKSADAASGELVEVVSSDGKKLGFGWYSPMSQIRVRMLFSGEEALKKVNVLSGGEKVRCVLSKMMLSGANFLIMDEPTNHLDMESITALNEGMTKFKGNIIFTSHDHQLTQTVANRIFDIKSDKFIDRELTYNDYLNLEQKKFKIKGFMEGN